MTNDLSSDVKGTTEGGVVLTDDGLDRFKADVSKSEFDLFLLVCDETCRDERWTVEDLFVVDLESVLDLDERSSTVSRDCLGDLCINEHLSGGAFRGDSDDEVVDELHGSGQSTLESLDHDLVFKHVDGTEVQRVLDEFDISGAVETEDEDEFRRNDDGLFRGDEFRRDKVSNGLFSISNVFIETNDKHLTSKTSSSTNKAHRDIKTFFEFLEEL